MTNTVDIDRTAPLGTDLCLLYFLNRKEGIYQESVQLSNTFRSKTPKGKKDALKATAPKSKHCKQKAERTVSCPKMAKRLSKIKHFTKTYMQRMSVQIFYENTVLFILHSLPRKSANVECAIRLLCVSPSASKARKTAAPISMYTTTAQTNIISVFQCIISSLVLHEVSRRSFKWI